MRCQTSLLGILLFLCWSAAANAAMTLGVSSPAALFSPGNWAGDSGRGGSSLRTTWNNGAWCQWRWSAKSAHPQATLQISNPTSGSTISYFLDGALTDGISVPASGGIPLSGLAGPGPHLLTVYTRSSPQARRWSGANAFTVTGLTVDADAIPGSSQARRPWILIVGDSITEGIQANNGGDSNLSDYSFLVGQGLSARGYDTSVSACGYSGWLRAGDSGGDVPAYYIVHEPGNSRWNKIDARTSLLDTRGHLSADGGLGEEPAMILLNYGVNECLNNSSPADMAVSVEGALSALRRASPRTEIVVLVPPGLADTRIYPNGKVYGLALQAGAGAYLSAHRTDHRLAVLDLGPATAYTLGSPAYGGGVHPNAAGHAYLAPLILQALLVRLPPAASR